MLACMNRLFEDLLPGSFYPADRNTYASLEDAYEILETEANSSKRQYNVKVLAGDSEIKRFDFTIKGKKDSILCYILRFSRRFYKQERQRGRL